MTASVQPSLSEAPQNMVDVPDPETPEVATPASAPPSTEPAHSAEQQESDTVAGTSEYSRSSAAKRSQQPANTIAPESAVAAIAPESAVAAIAPESAVAAIAPESAVAAIAPESAATTTTQNISISTNTAIGLFSALVTVFGGVLIALLAYILNTNTNHFNATVSQLSSISGQIGALNTKIDTVNTNLNTKIDTVNTNLNTKIDTKIDALDTKLSGEIKALDTKLSTKFDALAQQQTDTDETLSVLLAVLNVRNEVEAAKAHEITSAVLP